MKREIKFRAWDGDKKEMHLPEYTEKEDFHILADGSIVYTREHGYERHELTSRRPDTWILMQFTGLHDKNGKEIYEGDVVNRIDILNPHIKRPLQVTYKDGAFNVHKYYCLDDEENGYTKWFRLEIIGNIYENPELLNP